MSFETILGFIDFPQVIMALKLLLAALLGGLIGYEREQQARPAGLRTHMLVSMGAAVFSMLAFAAYPNNPNQGIMASSIVIGIGFIGAGTIVHFKEKIFGLTTAASLWLTASIGVAVGTGFYFLAMIAAVIGFLILSLKPMEKEIRRNSKRKK